MENWKAIRIYVGTAAVVWIINWAYWFSEGIDDTIRKNHTVPSLIEINRLSQEKRSAKARLETAYLEVGSLAVSGVGRLARDYRKELETIIDKDEQAIKKITEGKEYQDFLTSQDVYIRRMHNPLWFVLKE